MLRQAIAFIDQQLISLGENIFVADYVAKSVDEVIGRCDFLLAGCHELRMEEKGDDTLRALFYRKLLARDHTPFMRLAADLIIINANVRTMDPNQPTASAIAVLSNRIVAIGENEDLKQLAGSATRMIDVEGQLVLPGFNDAHVHFMSGGFQLSSVDLRDANAPEELAERIRDFAALLPEGKWVTGGDWDHERWPEAQLPTKELIDGF